MLRKTIVTGCAGIALSLAAGSAWSAANFENDVNTAINKGIDYLETLNSFAPNLACSGSNFGHDATGLALLAVLEKRASGNLADPPQGYVGASEADKTRMRRAAACILDRANEAFGTYNVYIRGNFLMALALYARTGGPDKGAADIPNDPDLFSLTAAIDNMTDTLLSYQGTTSPFFWGYGGPGTDSSTTQFAAAGLAGAKAYYLAKGDPGSRVAKINKALADAATGYATTATTGSSHPTCGVIEASEKGYGYRTGYVPSMQQTASGMWVQLLGGSTVNSPGVQAYMHWLRNHYQYTATDSYLYSGFTSYGYWYSLWSGIKGLLTIEESNIAPDPGNLGANAYGELAADASCTSRQLHRDPATVVRNAYYGAGGAGYYADEPKSTYFDYASTILGHQCNAASGQEGNFACNLAPSSVDAQARVAFSLLVLQRATGGACADANNDGVCDGDDGGGPPTYARCDVDGNGKITTDDLRAMVSSAKKRKKLPKNSAVAPGDAAANVVTAMYDPKKGGWFSSTGDTEINIADFTRCIFLKNGI